ncbi:hypothetical protein HK405_005056 [Cladochytrium tenue]|nr:hypothetical protein HK405_005056 [Cladochytrium tenue]
MAGSSEQGRGSFDATETLVQWRYMASPAAMTSIAGSRSTSGSSASQSTRHDRGGFSSGATSSDNRNLGDVHAFGRLLDPQSAAGIISASSSTDYFNDYASGESGSSSNRTSDDLGNLSVGIPTMPQQRRLDRRVDIQGQDKKKRSRNKEKQKIYDANRKVRRLELTLFECQKKDFEEGVQFQEFVARLLHTFWSHQSPEQYPHQMMTFTQDAIKAAKRKVANFADSMRWRLPLPADVKSTFKYLMNISIPSNLGVTIPEFFELLFELNKGNRGTSIIEAATHPDNVNLIEGVRRNIPMEVAEFLGLPPPNPGQATSATRSAAPSARSSFSPPAPQQTPPPSVSPFAHPPSPDILNNLIDDVVAFATGNNACDSFIELGNLPSSAENIEGYQWLPAAPYAAPVSMLPFLMTAGPLPLPTFFSDSPSTASAATASIGVGEQQQVQLTAVDPGFSPLQKLLFPTRAHWMPHPRPRAAPPMEMQARRDPTSSSGGVQQFFTRDPTRGRKFRKYMWARKADGSVLPPVPYATPLPTDGSDGEGSDGSENASHWAAELGPPDWAERIKRPAPVAVAPSKKEGWRWWPHRRGGKGPAIVSGDDDEARALVHPDTDRDSAKGAYLPSGSDAVDDDSRRGGLDFGSRSSSNAVGEPSDLVAEAQRSGPSSHSVMLSHRPLPFRVSGALRISGQHDRSSGGDGVGGSDEKASLPTSTHSGHRHHHQNHHHHLDRRQQQRQQQHEQQQHHKKQQRGPAAALAFEHMAALAKLTQVLTNGAVTLSSFAAAAAATAAARQEGQGTADDVAAAASAVRAHWAVRAAEYRWAAAAARGAVRLVREKRVDAAGLRLGVRKAVIAVVEARHAAGIGGDGGSEGSDVDEVPWALELFASHVAKELQAEPGFSADDVFALACEGDEDGSAGGNEAEEEGQVAATGAGVKNTSVSK